MKMAVLELQTMETTQIDGPVRGSSLSWSC